MILYLGSGTKRKIIFNNQKLILSSIVIDSKIKSADEYVLKDKNNLFLTYKEEDEQ